MHIWTLDALISQICNRAFFSVGWPKGVQVKSLLDRFGDRCQERTNSPAGRSVQQPAVNRPATPSSSLVQSRLTAAQAAKTTTADLTQKQKLVGRRGGSGSLCARSDQWFVIAADLQFPILPLSQERETELAQIRNRPQVNNMWKSIHAGSETKNAADPKVLTSAFNTGSLSVSLNARI